jgi:hypothetical protein
MSSLTVTQIVADLLAIPAWIPITVCPGYLVAWSTDFYRFRDRSLVERIFWSVAVSPAIATITLVLISRFLSVSAACGVLCVSTGLCAVLMVGEWRQRSRAGQRSNIGWSPEATAALRWAGAWTMLAIAMLVDFSWQQRLYMSATIIDVGTRVDWIESILHTGVPPANPLYWFHHAASLRQYYFWYVDCAVVARMAHLPARAVLTASCVWSGFGLAALIGLCLKYLLEAGAKLRRQYLTCIRLLGVTGLDILALAGTMFLLHQPKPLDLEWWSPDEITSWIDSLLWVPHHVAALVCCMLAFLLASTAAKQGRRSNLVAILLIALCLASGFGLSIFVTFAFFLLMIEWAVWQMAFVRATLSVKNLALGGILSVLLLLPYLLELRQGTPGSGSGHLFTFAMREMIPAGPFLAMRFLQPFAAVHPILAANLVKLILLVPGYALELGFYLIVLLACAIPAWRFRRSLHPGERTLVFLALATLPIITFLRSSLISHNDFGWRAALFLQFPLLLLGGVLWAEWNPDKRLGDVATISLPQWLRSLATLAIFVGILSSATQVLQLRFGIRLIESEWVAQHRPNALRMSDTAAISSEGYRRLNRSIASDAIVQFNPSETNPIVQTTDQLDVQHQVAIAADKADCGAELGGDPSGCPVMAAAIDAVFRGASAEQARGACRQFGIGYLVARIYDPAWNDRNGWVWTLPAVVADPKFRALDCR